MKDGVCGNYPRRRFPSAGTFRYSHLTSTEGRRPEYFRLTSSVRSRSDARPDVRLGDFPSIRPSGRFARRFGSAPRSEPCPCSVGFRYVHRLYVMPRLHGIVVGCTVVIRHVVGNEVYVAPVLRPQWAAFGLVERDRLKDQVAVRDRATCSNLRFAPPVEQITSSRCTLETRLDVRGFPLDEPLGLFVACVVDHREVEMQSPIYIPEAFFGGYENCLNLRSVTKK